MKITFFSNIIGMKWVKQPHRYHVQRNTCANGNKDYLLEQLFPFGQKMYTCIVLRRIQFR